MFKGNGANCIRIVPNSASKFLAYEYLEGHILAYSRKTDPVRPHFELRTPHSEP